MRVVPLANDAVNEEWLSDRGRFQYDGLKRQRLGVPMVRKSDGGGLVPSSWEEALGRRDGLRAGLAKPCWLARSQPACERARASLLASYLSSWLANARAS